MQALSKLVERDGPSAVTTSFPHTNLRLVGKVKLAIDSGFSFDDALKKYSRILTIKVLEQVEIGVPNYSRSYCPLHQYVFLPAPNAHTVL